MEIELEMRFKLALSNSIEKVVNKFCEDPIGFHINNSAIKDMTNAAFKVLEIAEEQENFLINEVGFKD